MNTTYWAITRVRIRTKPVSGETVAFAPSGSMLNWTGRESYESTRRMDGKAELARWMEVRYTSRWGRAYIGWTYAGWLEPVAPPAPVDPQNEVVPIPASLRTPDPFDAQQYLVVDGKTAHNLCGHFCAAYLGNDAIDVFLDKARRFAHPEWLAGVKKDRGLGISAMAEMITGVYNFPVLRFAEALEDSIVGVLVSPGKLRALLEDGWRLIAGVRIDRNGKLISGGRIGHWVVLTAVQPYGINEGGVEIYNPFPNRMQRLRYSEFIRSMRAFEGGMTGLWVQAPPNPSSESVGAHVQDAIIAEFLNDIAAFLRDNREWLNRQRGWLDERRMKLDGLR